MSIVHTWCTNNNMVINNSKTKAMVMTTYQRAATLNSILHVQYNGVNLTNTENEKLLGVIVNSNLCWKQQFDKVARSLNKGIHLLRQIKLWDFFACVHTYMKNAQVVTGLQTSCYKSVRSQAVDKLSWHCLFPVVVASC
jgi:hypothetical protein